MASKTKISDVDKFRVESNWKKSVESAQLLSAKTSFDKNSLVSLLQCEQIVEEFIETHDINSEGTILKAKVELIDTNEKLLKLADPSTTVDDQALLLLAKLQLCQGFFQVAIATLNKLKLPEIAIRECEGTSLRNTRMLYLIAEAYAIKGKCLEKTKSSVRTKYKISELEDETIACYEQAGDLALLCLQQREKRMPAAPSDQAFVLSPFIEMALSRAPLLYIRKGRVNDGVDRYREILRAVETRFTQGLRKTIALELVQLLLRSCSKSSYRQIDLLARGEKAKGPKPSVYSSDSLFSPHNLDEEVLLLLLIAEAVSTREATLERNKETHDMTLTSVTAIYDLLALTLVKRAQFTGLTETFEKAMRFSFQEFHIWNQFANSLISSHKFAQALLVLAECNRLDPTNISVCLQAARLCYEYLQNYEKGLEWSDLALQCETSSVLLARAYLSKGIGLCMLAKESRLLVETQQYNTQALEMFKTAHEKDPNDYLATFHLGLQYASLRRINEAMVHTKLSLNQRSNHIHSLHLLTLLLSARKQHSDAMTLILAALEEYPDNLSLLMTKAKLQKIVEGPEEALSTYRRMLKLWKDLHEIDMDDDGSGSKSPVGTRSAWDKRSLAQITFNEFADRGSGSIRAESVAASKVEKALSDLASSMNSSLQPRAGPQRSWVIQAHIWLNLGELYLTLGQIDEAQNCVQETMQLYPHSVYVFYMKGLLLEYKGFLTEARTFYENAVSVNPVHTKSLYHLGVVLHKLGENRLAEKVLRDAINVDPHFYKAWFCLGGVLEEVGNFEDASNCHATGAQLESTCPVSSFNVIQRVMT